MNWRIFIAGGFVALACAFGVGLYTGVSSLGVRAQTVYTVGPSPKESVDLEQFWQAWSVLEHNFVQSGATGTLPTDEERVWGAIQGLTESYGDPYTVFLPPQEAKIFNENVTGTFGGVGMELGLRNGFVTVVAPIKGSPAERAGVLSGDKIIAIDGESSEGLSVDGAVKIIRGEKGTKVELTFLRDGTQEPIVVTIVRDIIQIPVIDTRSEGDVFVIELYSFTPTSPYLFREALREFFESGKTKLVLDLRGNPGGYLESSVEIASYFLPLGDVVVTEDTRGRANNTVHRSVGYNVFAGKKLSMAVLVDQGSASASEILAGALNEHGVAILVGEKTFGKGSVQQLVDLGGGAELKITVARWLTPAGTNISDGGLAPDIEVERTAEDRAEGRDPQMSAATTWLATQ